MDWRWFASAQCPRGNEYLPIGVGRAALASGKPASVAAATARMVVRDTLQPSDREILALKTSQLHCSRDGIVGNWD